MNNKNINYKPSIHFVVASGGSRGSFSGGFLYRMFTKYKQNFSTYRFDSCSVGSLNSLCICSGNVKNLKKVWYSIKDTNDIFYQYNSIRSAYNLINYNGCYSSKPLENIINKYEIKEDNLMNKFNCVVTNIKSGIYEYKNGTCRDIKKFVLASASCWILVPPLKIDNLIYTDGGLLQNYPINYVKNSLANLIVIVGFDDEHFNKISTSEGKTIFHYLARLIDITRSNNVNLHTIKNLLQTMPNIILVKNNLKDDFMDFNPTSIKKGFESGEKEADKFAFKHFFNKIKRCNSYNKLKLLKKKKRRNSI